jgi:hypothetical protein
MSTERWRALFDSRGELAVAELTDDPDCPLDDDMRVRVEVRLPNRWPSRKPAPLARWVEAVDRRDGAILWLPELLVCTPPRSALIASLAAWRIARK